MAIQYFARKTEAEEVPNSQLSWCIVNDGKPWCASTGDDVIPDLRPTVSKWQFVQACADAGITENQIDTAVAMLTTKRQRFWKYTYIIDRDNPMSSGLRSALIPVPTPQVWNAIFVAASQLNPLKV